jgi:hypothetical protein
MQSAHLLYTEEMYKRFGYLATWAPSVTVAVGDIGVLNGRVFERTSTLKMERITFQKRSDQTYADYEYTSADGVTIKVKGAGEAPMAGSAIAQADAGISYFFHNENAVVFQATHCRETSIVDQESLRKQILSLYEKEKWRENLVVVTNVIASQSTTILISSSTSGAMEFTIDASLNPGSAVQIATLGGGLKVARSSNVGTKIIGTKGLTPLFKALGIKKRFMRKPEAGRRGEHRGGLAQLPGAAALAAAPAIRFDQIAFDDFD